MAPHTRTVLNEATMNTPSAAAQPAPAATERRAAVRHACDLEALSRPLDPATVINWGTTHVDVSRGGVGLVLCFPFKLGTYLAVDLEHAKGVRTLLVRVAHVTDRSDGTWLVGCEFARPLSADDLNALL
jgi:hypothetical protein